MSAPAPPRATPVPRGRPPAPDEADSEPAEAPAAPPSAPAGRIGLVFATVAAAAYGITLPDYGLVSDEGNYFEASRRLFGWGQLAFEALRDGDVGRAFAPAVLDESWRWGGDRIPHPPFSRLVAGLSGALLYGRTDPLVAYRVLGVLVASAMVGMVAAWGARRGGWAGGLGAGAACLLMPRLFAHAHFAATDVLLAALLTGALFWACEARRAPMAGAGVLWGLALATKFSAVLLLPVLLVWLALFRRERLRRLPALLAAAAAAFVAVNPALWADPLAGAREYVRQGVGRREIPMAQLPTLYFGRLYTFRPPWHYAPVMLALTTPVGILLLAACGAAGGLRDARRRPAAAAAVVLGAAFLAALASPAAPLHDDVRLLLPVLPLTALLAGLGCAALLTSRRSATGLRRPAAFAPLLIGLALAEAAVGHVRLHPYQGSYYNVLTGGVSGAAARGLEVTTMKEVLNRDAFRDVNRILPPRATLDGGPFLFEELLFARDVAGWLREDVRLVAPPRSGLLRDAIPGGADYVLVVNRGGWLREADRALLAHATPAYAVRVAGVPLLALYRLR